MVDFFRMFVGVFCFISTFCLGVAAMVTLGALVFNVAGVLGLIVYIIGCFAAIIAASEVWG